VTDSAFGGEIGEVPTAIVVPAIPLSIRIPAKILPRFPKVHKVGIFVLSIAVRAILVLSIADSATTTAFLVALYLDEQANSIDRRSGMYI
jgi:hypothetical protein